MKSSMTMFGAVAAMCLAAVSVAGAFEGGDERFIDTLNSNRIGHSQAAASIRRRIVSEGASAASFGYRAPKMPDASSTWMAILEDGRVLASFPMIQFGNTSVSVDGVCRDGDSLMTLRPVHFECRR